MLYKTWQDLLNLLIKPATKPTKHFDNLSLNKLRRIDTLVVHVTDSPDKLDIGAEEIRDWHKQRGWKDIGYHFVIRRNGTVEKGRPVEQIGAHAEGYNSKSIGIVWVGKTDITDNQLESLTYLLLELCRFYNLTSSQIKGHTELNPGKSCPNLDMNSIRKDLALRLNEKDSIR